MDKVQYPKPFLVGWKTEINYGDHLRTTYRLLFNKEKIKQHLGDKTIKTIVKEGDSAKYILASAKELHIDMIVMGSHSRRWLEKILVGSVTQKVLNQTMVPILIIPTKQKE